MAQQNSSNRKRRLAAVGSKRASRTITEWLPHWHNELGARDASRRTVTSYNMSLRRLVRYVGDIAPETLTGEQLLAWRDEMHQGDKLKGASVNTYLQGVGSFLAWLTEEGILEANPIYEVPLIREREVQAPQVFDREQQKRITAGAQKRGRGRSPFEALRDEAILSFLADTGCRASECAGILVDNLNMGARQAYVHEEIAKGRRPRTVVFGFQTARLLTKYLRMREDHQYAFLDEVWVGRFGRLSYEAVWSIVRVAGKRGGVIGARPHLYRHTWAHDLKSQDVDTEVLMSLGGWTTTEMPMRYGRAQKTERAIAAYQRMGSPVDRAKMAPAHTQRATGQTRDRRNTG